ncbi:hypothetical protein EPR50_G00111760 [Perca flavescens]|uniref:Neuregulin 2 N-terminal domain-containing protein n=1 Tax=Perca flavescens TaxID=8167 RepID=A0A484CZE8_PERFV|nr:hypothetical protein EPR50_G00111760 [Perca flavescens]
MRRTLRADASDRAGDVCSRKPLAFDEGRRGRGWRVRATVASPCRITAAISSCPKRGDKRGRVVGEGECSNHIFKHAEAGRFRFLGWCVPPIRGQQPYGESSGRHRWHGHFHKVCRSALPALPEPVRRRLSLPARSAAQQHCSTAQADGMRLDPVHFSMLVIGVSFACYAPSLNSLQDQAYRSAVVIEGEVRSSPENVSSREPYSVNVKVLDVWPVNSGGLEREQLVTVGDFGSEAPCTTVEKDHRYIFFMDPTAEPLVFKASYAPVDASEPELKKDVEKVLCEDCGKFKAFPFCLPYTLHRTIRATEAAMAM